MIGFEEGDLAYLGIEHSDEGIGVRVGHDDDGFAGDFPCPLPSRGGGHWGSAPWG